MDSVWTEQLDFKSTNTGMGWGLTGACPGPMFALIGHGVWSIVIVLASALAGTWVYSALRTKIPH